MTPFERLEKAVQDLGMNLSQLSVLIGRKRQFLSSYKAKKGIGKNVLDLIEEKTGISKKYLEYGDEPIFVNNRVKEPGSVYDASGFNVISSDYVYVNNVIRMQQEGKMSKDEFIELRKRTKKQVKLLDEIANIMGYDDEAD